jgi:drug/metabolite transporter (DMT)-like permease
MNVASSVAGTTASRRGHGGLRLAAATAAVSGVSVFVNSYGVHHVRDAAVYTTGKNAVAGAILLVAAMVWGRRAHGGAPAGAGTTGRAAHLAGLAYVAAVGGGLAFVLFFDGLARTSAEPAAFLHDTLLVWVGLLAWPVLRERITPWHVGVVVALVAGQAAMTGGIGHLVAGEGQVLVLVATVLWAVEVVVAKRLLAALSPMRVAVARMAGGAVVLGVYLAVTGRLGTVFHLGAGQVGWMALTGLLLAAYVATWFGALARARALDVTAVLAGSVVITALCQSLAGTAWRGDETLGLALVAVGVAGAAALSLRAGRDAHPEAA